MKNINQSNIYSKMWERWIINLEWRCHTCYIRVLDSRFRHKISSSSYIWRIHSIIYFSSFCISILLYGMTTISVSSGVCGQYFPFNTHRRRMAKFIHVNSKQWSCLVIIYLQTCSWLRSSLQIPVNKIDPLKRVHLFASPSAPNFVIFFSRTRLSPGLSRSH